MSFINNDLASIIKINQATSTVNFNPVFNGLSSSVQGFNDDDACSSIPDMFSKMAGFDMTMDSVAAFQDVISISIEGLTAMKSEGESIRDLVAKAKEDGCSEETLNALQEEVDRRIAEIRKIRENTNFNGIKPFDNKLALTIPNWQELLGMEEKETDEAKNEISEMIASFDIDMNINAGFFNLGGTAKINVGYTEDGSLQITVDTAFDFDLSGLEEMGIKDENAMDIINNFLALITGQQNSMGGASNFISNLFASASASIEGDGFSIDATNDINMSSDDSKKLQGQIVQHAAITLANTTANFPPSIAINIL